MSRVQRASMYFISLVVVLVLGRCEDEDDPEHEQEQQQQQEKERGVEGRGGGALISLTQTGSRSKIGPCTGGSSWGWRTWSIGFLSRAFALIPWPASAGPHWLARTGWST